MAPSVFSYMMHLFQFWLREGFLWYSLLIPKLDCCASSAVLLSNYLDGAIAQYCTSSKIWQHHKTIFDYVMIEAGCSDNPGGHIKGVWISEGPLFREGNISWLEEDASFSTSL